MNENGIIVTCEICGNKFYIGTYSGDYCRKCGQQYEYDEGHYLVLDHNQREFIRNGANKIKQIAGILHNIELNTKKPGPDDSWIREKVYINIRSALRLIRELPVEWDGVINLKEGELKNQAGFVARE